MNNCSTGMSTLIYTLQNTIICKRIKTMNRRISHSHNRSDTRMSIAEQNNLELKLEIN
jgi:hypothetical protein